MCPQRCDHKFMQPKAIHISAIFTQKEKLFRVITNKDIILDFLFR